MMTIEVFNINHDLLPSEIIMCVARELIYVADKMDRDKENNPEMVHVGEELDLKISKSS